MRFNGFLFWLFLAVVAALHATLPSRTRRPLLLGASYLFYASWYWPHALLLFGTAALNHIGARWIAKAPGDRRRLALVVAADVAILGAFKYLDFLFTNANGLFGLLALPVSVPLPHWILPLGISFYVFECISYVVDIARKRESVRSFSTFQLYVAFFPHLLAGPILRTKEFIPQVEKSPQPTAEDVRAGLLSVAWGLFVKVVLADGLAPEVDGGFARPASGLGGLDAWALALGFGLQIYFDFSSYTRIALGAARFFGLRLVDNFNHPFLARSPGDFWGRWHMSLSRWIRDYLFFPLAGQKPARRRLMLAAIGSMVASGIWHGAAWTFVAWGLYHGLLLAAQHGLTARPGHGPAPAARPRPSRARALGAVGGTLALVTLGWLLFRASGLREGLILFAHALTPWVHRGRALPGTFYAHVAVLAGAVLAAPSVEAALGRWRLRAQTGRALSWAIIEGAALAFLAAGVLVYLDDRSTFIYFQF